MKEAGADALELNVYQVPTDPRESGESIEHALVDMARAVVSSVDVPVAIKLSPFHTSLPHLARRLDDVGVAGLVLFNRFYQADIDVETLEALPTLQLSDPSELRLRLTWLAVLSGLVRASLAVTGGVHSGIDAVKAVMAGAHGIQMVSALLRNGPEHVRVVLDEMVRWLHDHEYESLDQMRGSMSCRCCPDPGVFERVHYMRILQGWKASE